MKTQLAKWGNSMAVRIPKSVAEAAKLRPGDLLELAVEGLGMIKICRRRREPTLEQLVAAITVENRHAEVDWGKPLGHEVWSSESKFPILATPCGSSFHHRLATSRQAGVPLLSFPLRATTKRRRSHRCAP